MSIQRRYCFIGVLLAGAIVFLSGTCTLQAATRTWDGGGGSNTLWSTAANWSDNTVPIDIDNAVIPGGYSITFAGNATIANLALTGTVTFSMGGYLLTVSNTLDVGSSSAVGVLLLDDESRNLVLQVNGAVKLNYAASRISNAQASSSAYDVVIQLGPLCTIYMAAATCYIGNTTETKSVFTTMSNSTALTSLARFEGDLVLPAGLILGSYDLYLGRYAGLSTPNATVGETGNFVQTAGGNSNPMGVLRKQFSGVGEEFYFPVGPAGERMCPITFKVVSPTLPGAFTSYVPWPHISVRCVLNSTGQGGHPENQQKQKIWIHWPVQAYGISCPGIYWAGLMTFHNNYRNGGPDDLYSARYTDNYEDVGAAGGWNLTGSVQVFNTSGSIRSVPFGPWLAPYTTPGMPCWGDFTVGTGTPGGDPIPVELISFSARYVRDKVELNWQTATELNNYGFAIERSRDTEEWEEIGFVPGTGNSFSPKSYTYTDALDANERQVPQLAYRLRQIDRDGTDDYSNSVFVNTQALPSGVVLYDAYPNPFNPSTTLSFSLDKQAPVRITVYNIYGQQVAVVLDGDELGVGVHTVKFHASTLPSGSYIISLNVAGSVRYQRIVLSK